MKHIGIFKSSLRIMQAARLTLNVAQTEACRCTTNPRLHLCRPKITAPELAMLLFEGTRNLLPYIDINPHKTGPKWPVYVGIAILLVITIAIVTLALTNH